MLRRDSIPARRARETVELLQRETSNFISSHRLTLRTPTSRDLNSVDCKVWGDHAGGLYAKRIGSVDELKQRISDSDEWDELDQRLTALCVAQERSRLQACPAAQGLNIKSDRRTQRDTVLPVCV